LKFRPSGISFGVDKSPELMLKEGDIVTINYESFTQNSVPVNPKIYRVRKDISWGDVQFNYLSDATQDAQFNGIA
jgi:hypothetical protein